MYEYKDLIDYHGGSSHWSYELDKNRDERDGITRRHVYNEKRK
jgi:hypothetical protein